MHDPFPEAQVQELWKDELAKLEKYLHVSQFNLECQVALGKASSRQEPKHLAPRKCRTIGNEKVLFSMN